MSGYIPPPLPSSGPLPLSLPPKLEQTHMHFSPAHFSPDHERHSFGSRAKVQIDLTLHLPDDSVFLKQGCGINEPGLHQTKLKDFHIG